MSFSHLNNDEESRAIKESRAIAQSQFVDLSVKYVQQSQELNRYKAAYRSASTRAAELSTLLAEEV